MTSSPFFLDDASASSSSRMMSMSDRQNQLVLQRRQQIIRQHSQVNSNHHLRGGTNEYEDSKYTPTAINDSAMSCSPAHHQVANRTSEEISVHSSPSELSCTSTAIKHTSVVKDKSEFNASDKENEEALYRLERELENNKKELEETRAKLEEKDDDAGRMKAELDQLRNEKDSQQRRIEQQLLQATSPVDVQDDSKLTHRDGKLNQIANVVTTAYSSGGSVVGGSDSGYQRYLHAYHHQPEISLLTKQQPDATTSEISDLTLSRRLSSTSSSRPISRARHSHEEFPSSSTQASSEVEVVERKSFEEGANGHGQEQDSTISDSQRRETPTSRSLPLLQKQLTSSSIASANLDDPVVMRSILMNPCPKDGGMVQCCIRRNKKGMTNTLGGLFPEYRCYLKGKNNCRTETFLMTSKKRAANKTSNYLISMGRNDHGKDSKNILGKLRANYFDTEYVMYDNGKNPDDCKQDGTKNDGGDARVELGAILYAPSVLGAHGPRQITVCISNVDEKGKSVKVWQPNHKHDDSMLDSLKTMEVEEVSMSSVDKDKNLLIYLQSKPPAWDEALQRYFLNFNGRVTMASVKNFQLVDEKGNICLQFGRRGKDEFILDVQWPLSPFQAFALALSSFDSKVGCD